MTTNMSIRKTPVILAMVGGLLLTPSDKAHADEPITVALITAAGTIIAASIKAYASSRKNVREIISSDIKKPNQSVKFSTPDEPSNVVNHGSASVGRVLKDDTYLTSSINVVQISDVLRTKAGNSETSFFVGYEMDLKLESSETDEKNCVTINFENLTLTTTDVLETHGEASIKITARQFEREIYTAELRAIQGEKPNFADLPDFEKVSVFEGGASGTDISVPISCTKNISEDTSLILRFEFSGIGKRIL